MFDFTRRYNRKKSHVLMKGFSRVFEFSATVRGFHHYLKYWTPVPEQELHCDHEKGNAFDRYAIKVCEMGKDVSVGHLPKEFHE